MRHNSATILLACDSQNKDFATASTLQHSLPGYNSTKNKFKLKIQRTVIFKNNSLFIDLIYSLKKSKKILYKIKLH